MPGEEGGPSEFSILPGSSYDLLQAVDALVPQMVARDGAAEGLCRRLLALALGPEHVRALEQLAAAALQPLVAGAPEICGIGGNCSSYNAGHTNDTRLVMRLQGAAAANTGVRKAVHFALACVFPALMATTLPETEVSGDANLFVVSLVGKA